MGVEKILICESCAEYVYLDKMPMPRFDDELTFDEFFDEAPNYKHQTKKLMSFINIHQGGCRLNFVSEVGEFSDLFISASLSDSYEEFDHGLNINDEV